MPGSPASLSRKTRPGTPTNRTRPGSPARKGPSPRPGTKTAASQNPPRRNSSPRPRDPRLGTLAPAASMSSPIMDTANMGSPTRMLSPNPAIQNEAESLKCRWKARADRCTAHGEGVNTARAGVAASFIIKAQRESAHNITWGGEDFVVRTLPAHLSRYGNTMAKSKTSMPSARFQPRSGSGGDQVIEMKPEMHVAGVNNEARPRGWAGYSEETVHHTHHQSQGPGGLTIKDQGDGTYKVSYVIEVAGDYLLLVLLDGMHIMGSPFALNVQPADIVYATLVYEGEGDPTVQVTAAGTTVTYQVQTRDNYNNMRLCGGDPFETKLEARPETLGNRKVVGPQALTNDSDHQRNSAACGLLDHGNGTYSIHLTAKQVAVYDINVLLGHQPVCPSLSVEVVPAAVDGSSSTAVGSSLTEVCSGQIATFVIEARDHFGNLQMEGGDRWSMSMLPIGTVGAGKEIEFITQDNEDGTYSVQFCVEEAGDYELTIMHFKPHMGGGTHIYGSPFAVTCWPNMLCAHASSATGECLYTATAGETHTFHVQPRDELTNQRPVQPDKGGDQLTVSVVAAQGYHQGDVKITQHLDGDYCVNYRTTLATEHFINVEFRGQAERYSHVKNATCVKGSPFRLKVDAGPTHPASCELEQLRANAQMVSGVGYSAMVQVYDEFKNKRKTGGDEVKMMLKQGELIQEMEVVDNLNGTYQVLYFSEVAAPCEVLVTVDGYTIQGMPFNLEFVPAQTEPTASKLYPGTDLVGQELVAGQEVLFTVQACDKFGNNCIQGGEKFEASLTMMASKPETWDRKALKPDPWSPAEETRVDDVGDGTYIVSVTPSRAGPAAINVTLNGIHMIDSAFHVTIVPGFTYAEQCVAFGDGLTQTRKMEEASFTIQARDECGNNGTFGGDTFNVTILPRHHRHHASVKSIVDNNDGSYKVRYVAAISGQYLTEITLGKVPIRGSPFSLNVGTIDPGTYEY